MKALAAVIFSAVCLGLGGCVSQNSSPVFREEWPPKHVVLDPTAVYVTGESDGPQEREVWVPAVYSKQGGLRRAPEGQTSNLRINDVKIVPAADFALENAIKNAQKMGIPHPVLSELCRETDGKGIRIFYRVLPRPEATAALTPSGTGTKNSVILPGEAPTTP